MDNLEILIPKAAHARQAAEEGAVNHKKRTLEWMKRRIADGITEQISRYKTYLELELADDESPLYMDVAQWLKGERYTVKVYHELRILRVDW